MELRGLVHHVELYVGDLERSIGFWGPLLTELGYECETEWDDGTRWRRGPTALSFVQVPDDGAGGFDRRQVGLNHVAFHVGTERDVDALTERLTAAAGARLLYPERHPHAGGPTHYAAFLEDPDGIKVELVASDVPGPSGRSGSGG